ncbi:hypothetical protein UFOVP116_193 [uncultured Caudovirales phage]|uniref:WYL domain containing protein n=1 Tax=uncultured Caudovirales phage TaxID=2100421 RepID=A0A6J5LA52_9CAUD|nr:hypothetical protein UFOVP116_193 [uncultured Caudovirales phage]
MHEVAINAEMLDSFFAKGISKLVYFDTNGRVNEFICTKDQRLTIPVSTFVPKSNKPIRSVMINLYDVARQEWRSFLVSNVICVESI